MHSLLPALAGILSVASAFPTTSSLRKRDSFRARFEAGNSDVPTAFVKEAHPDLKAAAGSGPVRYVENSGVCETTPGVYQASGYVDIASDQHAFFWYFAARNNPDTAPVTIWLNGGPGSSSMIGLFQELGPCRVRKDSSGLDLNPNSWNEVSNLLFIDQPIGTGFSYGTSNVGTTEEASADVYKVLQGLLKDPNFANLANHSWGLATESYGGHYGPSLAMTILSENSQAAANGNIAIPFKTLMIGNGYMNSLAEQPGYVQYAASNPYLQFASASTIQRANYSLYKSGGCLAQERSCQVNNDPTTCRNAEDYCGQYVFDPLIGNRDPYDVRANSNDPYPPAFDKILADPTLLKKIGAETKWSESSDAVGYNFYVTGDSGYNYGPYLGRVIDAGVRVHLLDGDADFICGFKSYENAIAEVQSSVQSLYNSQPLASWTVDGKPAGLYKNAKNLSYTRNAGAGHEVPAYGTDELAVGRAALVMFTQVLSGQPITNT